MRVPGRRHEGHAHRVGHSAQSATSLRCGKGAHTNGAGENNHVLGIADLADKRDVFIGGDGFRPGQTKMKSVLVELSGLYLLYNHHRGNDGTKLFRSTEISKDNVVDDMVLSREILFSHGTDKPDHCIVIIFLPMSVTRSALWANTRFGSSWRRTTLWRTLSRLRS